MNLTPRHGVSRDVTSNVGLPTGANFPTKDEDGNLLETQYGESCFRDQQVGRQHRQTASSVLTRPHRVASMN